MTGFDFTSCTGCHFQQLQSQS